MESLSPAVMPRALTIAGSDSSGGAGIQRDLATFLAFGVWGTSAVTSVTAQSTTGVHDRFDLPAAIVGAQIRAVASDIRPDAAKTGMLARAAIVEEVARCVRDLRIPNLVVDPVMISTSGEPLLDDDGIAAVLELLLPLAAVVTPNAAEASRLTGIAVVDEASQRQAARELCARGARAAIVTGGHVASGADVLVAGGEAVTIGGERREAGQVHGTGCAYSAAVAAGLARGEPLAGAARAAKRTVERGIDSAVRVGKGMPVLGSEGR